MSNNKQCTIIRVYKICKTFQMVKVQKGIRFVHNQKIRLHDHLFHNLNQFKFTTAQAGKRCILLILQFNQFQEFSNITLITIPIHRLKFI